MREWLPRLALDRPVTVTMGFFALLVLGLVAWARIPIQMMPDGFEPGFMWLRVPYPGSSPIETDEKIVRPVTAQLSTVTGIRTLRSFADADGAGFAVELHGSVDVDEAYNEIVDRLERALLDMPEDVERYGIYRYDPNAQPVIWAGVQIPEDVEDPWHLVTRVIQPRLERIPGVATLDVWGVPQNGIWIDYDRERVSAHRIDLGSLQQRIATDNFQMASGRIVDRGLVRHARSLARLDVQDFADYPVSDALVLSDIADVMVGAARSASINRINGREAAALAIHKESSANTVELAREVARAFEELEADPRTRGSRFFVFFNQGELIQESIDNLVDSAITGGVLALVILFAFLREWRLTLLIAASIPLSLLITVGVLWSRGDTLNVLSLMGLMLAVGMVVDNAIVVVETIYRRRAEGADPREAAISGTGEVNLAILASTATTMIVFLPIILMSESAEFSFFMGQVGFPVVFALGASLIIALLVAPLATRFMTHATVRPDPRWLELVARRYRRMLGWVLSHRLDTAMLTAAVAILTMTVVAPGVKCSSGMDQNLNDFTIRFEVPPQAGLAEREAIVARLEEVVEANREAWGVRVHRTRLSEDSTRGALSIYLESDGPLTRDEVMAKAREALPTDMPGVRATVGWDVSDRGGAGANQMRLVVHGEEVEVLLALAEEIERRVETVDGVLDATVDAVDGGLDELRLIIDRDALIRYGVTAGQVGQVVAYAMRGSALTPVRIDEKEIAVTSRFSLEDRSDLDTVLGFEVWSPITGSLVPIRAMARTEVARGPSQIRREDGRTSMGITLDLAEGTTSFQLFDAMDAALADMVFPRGYSWSKGQRFDMQQENDAAMGLALVLSVCFVFLLMGVLFESFVLPLGIITTVPMAVTGAMWLLWATSTPFDTMAGVGMVILVGVVVNNGIVLVDRVTQLRREGVPRTEALLEAGQRRLRPILMTAFTTICGLVPMALGSSAVVGIPYAPLGRTVIGGLTAATVLTLLLVPVLYSLLDDLRTGAMSWFAWVRGARA